MPSPMRRVESPARRIWGEVKDKLGEKQLRALATLAVLKENPNLSPEDLKGISYQVREDGLLVFYGKGKVLYRAEEIYRDVEKRLRRLHPTRTIGEEDVKKGILNIHVELFQGRGIDWSITSQIPQKEGSVSTSGMIGYREGDTSYRVGWSPSEVTIGVDRGVRYTYHIPIIEEPTESSTERRGNYLSLSFGGGSFYVFAMLSNPYLKLTQPSRWFALIGKTSFTLQPSLVLGPLSVTPAGVSFSWGMFSFNFLMWALTPYMGEEWQKRIGKFQPTSMEDWVNLIPTIGVAGLRAIYSISGLERAVHEMRKVKEGGLLGLIKKGAAFLKGWALGLYETVTGYIAYQARAFIRDVVETFYFLHHLFRIPARPFQGESMEDYLERMREIREEIRQGYYLKAAKDVEGLLRSPSTPAWLKGELEAYHEFLTAQGITHNGFLNILNILTFGALNRVVFGRAREREEMVRDIVKRWEEGKASPEEAQWALGYLSAKLYNPYSHASLPGHMAPLTPLQSLTPEEAYFYLYQLGKGAVAFSPKGDEEAPFYYVMRENLETLAHCCAPLPLLPYVEGALSNLPQPESMDRLAVSTIIRRLREGGVKSLLFPKNDVGLYLMLLNRLGVAALRGEDDEKLTAEIKQISDERPELVTKTLTQLTQELRSVLEQWEQGEMDMEELALFLSQRLGVLSGLLSLYGGNLKRFLSDEDWEAFKDAAYKTAMVLLGTDQVELFSRLKALSPSFFSGIYGEEYQRYAVRAIIATANHFRKEGKADEYVRSLHRTMEGRGLLVPCSLCQDFFEGYRRAENKLAYLNRWWVRVS